MVLTVQLLRPILFHAQIRSHSSWSSSEKICGGLGKTESCGFGFEVSGVARASATTKPN